MTNEEAIKMLQTEKACVERQERKQSCNRYCESCDLCMPIEDVIDGYNTAIRALKNEQTGGDLISKQAVITMLQKICNSIDDGNGFQLNEWVEYVKQIPSEEKLAPIIRGEWIKTRNNTNFVCSNCGHFELYYNHHKYCPNCGAKMKGVD